MMIVYNTTYTMPVADARNFVIWVHQSMLPRIGEDGALSVPRLLRVLSHHDQETECFSLQFEAGDTSELHRWFVRQGRGLAEELQKMFDGRVIGFSTLMEYVSAE